MNIREHFFRKFVFPRVLVIDKPGLIISKNFSNLNPHAHKMRIAYNFEDFYVELYFDTLKQLGRKKTERLWYKMGKELGIRYFLFNGKQDLSPSKIPFALKYFQTMFTMIGMGLCENLKYNFSEGKYIFWGKNNVIVRKTGSTAFIEGIISGVISFITNENFEAKGFYEVESSEGKIVVDKKFSDHYTPDFSSFKIIPKYDLNFLRNTDSCLGLYTFSDLLKFGLVHIDDDRKFFFGKYSIFPTEISLIELIAKNYFKIGQGKLFRESTIKFVSKFCEDFFEKMEGSSKKMKFFQNILSAFGYGEVYIRKKENFVRVDFLNPIFTEFGLYYLKCFINGFVNHFFEEDYFFDFDKVHLLGNRESFFYYSS